MKPIIQLHKICYAYDKNKEVIMKEFSLDIKKGEICTILGPSGCGKSTLIDLIANRIKPQKGYIEYANEIINYNQIGIIFQKHTLFPWMTVYKNIDFSLKMREKNQDKRKKIINEWLNKFDLYNIEKKYPFELSGGMYARVTLLRTLLLNHKVILVDEAFGALDFATKNKVLKQFKDTIKENNITAIIVTHSIEEAAEISDRIIIMSNIPMKIIYDCNNNEYNINKIKQMIKKK